MPPIATSDMLISIYCQISGRMSIKTPAAGKSTKAYDRGRRGKIRCGEGLLIPSTFGANYSSVVPTRAPLSSLSHATITQDTTTLSRLQKDYSSHPQEPSVEDSKIYHRWAGQDARELANAIT